MKIVKILIMSLFLIQGYLMSATVKEIDVNGVKIPMIFERDSSLPIVSMQLVFRNSGSLQDGDKFGLAGFSARIFNEGTKKLGSTKFAAVLDDNAIHLNVNNGHETFVFEISSLKEKFPLAVKELKSLLSDPNLSEQSFQRVKTMTLGDISSKENNFDYIADLNLKEMLFKDTPLGHSSLGSKKSIEALKLDDVKEFIKKHIVDSRAMVVIGGDVDESDAIKYAKKALSVLNVGEYKKVGFYRANSDEETKVIKKDTKQAYIYFGSPFDMRVNDKDAYKAKVAAFILGSSGFGSRLMEGIRVKKGLAYSVYARVNLNKSYSNFTGYLQTKVTTKEQAVKAVKEIIANFIKNGATENELKAAKEFLSGSEPLRVETISQRLNRAFFEYYRGLKLGYFNEELKLIEKLKLKDLNSFIKKHPEILKLTFSIVTK